VYRHSAAMQDAHHVLYLI